VFPPVRRVTLTFTLAPLALALIAVPSIAVPTAGAQESPPQCACKGGGPPVVPPGNPGGGPGPNREPNDPDGDRSWVALLPLGPLAAILGHRSGAMLAVAASDTNQASSVREALASQAFHANVDSLSRGMRAPDTATPLPTVAVVALTLGTAGGLLLRRRSA
jgi:hypothetical protein